MSIEAIVLIILLVSALLLAGLIILRQRILASRAARIGVAVLTLPVILFCLFGFLASFEGSGGIFLAFRIGYVVLASVLGLSSVYLLFGRLRRVEGAVDE